MKKTILALAIIMVFAASSFASVSFLTAGGVGAGKWDVLGVYGTDHLGAIANTENPAPMDSTSLGIKAGYGLMDGLDLLLGYSSDTYANLKDWDEKQTDGSTVGIGLKYTIPKSVNNMLPVDYAFLVGYEKSTVGYKYDEGGSQSKSITSYTLGVIFSKQIGIWLPYSGIAVKSLSQEFAKGGGDATGGTGLMLNLGCWMGIAENQAVAIEYNTENDAWGDVTYKGHNVEDKSATSVSGLSLGYVYMF